MEIEFRLFDVFSLKDKRKTLKSLKDKIKRMFNVSVSEVNSNDIINYSTVGFACVSNNKAIIESTFEKILHFLENSYNIELTNIRKDFL